MKGGLERQIMEKKSRKETKEVENEKVCAILSYILVGIIWYFADEEMKKSEFAKYHAKQGLVLLIASIVYCIVLQIVLTIVFLPLVLVGIRMGLGVLVLLYYVPLVWVVIGMINAAKGKTSALPLIGKFAEKLSF